MTDPDKEGRYTGTPRCRICSTDEGITRHHMIPRSMSGRKLRAKIRPAIYGHRCNIIKLCRDCHLRVERDEGTMRSSLRDLLNPNELRFLQQTAGPAWLNKNYPRSVDRWIWDYRKEAS